ncbi:MAG TPA: hypothetical protein DDW65_05730 [Firmicutes bacterium]|jgi:uncharacterized protein (DUF362 family)|nr:hypothetical protein [Bacillota bacterium]
MEQVSLLRVESYQELPAKIIQLLEPLGGLGAFCRRGERVLLKPNFIMARSVESAATTNPAIILALATLLKDLGCTVAVGDSPGLGSAAAVVHKLGLTDEFKHRGVQVVELETLAPFNPKRSAVFERRYKNLQLAKELNGFDRIINLPKLKTHGQMGLTLATKNLFGCVAGHNKAQWHFTVGKDTLEFARLLVEIAMTVNASLHILDGIIGMEGNGPSNGRPRQLNVMMAGTNPLAMDRVVVELIQNKPEQFPIFAAAQIMKIPGLTLAEIQVLGDTIHSCQINDFEIPVFHTPAVMLKSRVLSNIVAGLLKQRLILNERLCTKCRRCETQCPAKAIDYRGKIRINQTQCIRCCCCQEMCPVGALSIKTPLMVKILRKIKLM